MTALSGSVDLARHGHIAVLTVDNPPANALSPHVRKGLKDGLAGASGNPAVGAIVIAAAGPAFIGGGDPAEFGKPPQPPGVHEILDVIEGAVKPVVAALHGTSIHIGLEVALACHYRVAGRAARVGVFAGKLGLLPAAGGTQRLPRLVGVEKALQMIVGGETIGAEDALRHGLLDEIVEGALIPAAVAFAEKVLSERRPLRRTRDLDDKLAAARGKPEIVAAFRKSVARQTRGFKAPGHAIAAVEAAMSLPFAEGLARERALFLELLDSPESRAQRYIFVAERDAAQIPDVPAGTPAREIRKAAVIGAGTMGGGIAMNFANVGIPVTVVEVEPAALARGLGVVRRNYETTAARGAADRAGRRDPDGAHHRHHRLRRRRRRRHRRRGGVRGDGRQEGGLRQARRPREARRGARHQCLDARRERDCRPHPPARGGDRHALLQPRQRQRLLENVRGARSSATTIATAMAMGGAGGRSARAWKV